MILSRFCLNPSNRQVQRCVNDSYALHVLVMSMFPQTDTGEARASLGVLHRLEISEQEGTICLLVQSRDAPDTSCIPPRFLDPRAGNGAVATASLDVLEAAIVVGARLRFRLRANPTRKIDTKTRADGKRRNGRRVPVSGDDGRASWLVRHLEAHGMRLEQCEDGPSMTQRPDGTTCGTRSQTRVTHDAHVFDGILEIADARLACDALANGIGPAKAFGFGLLSLDAPVARWLNGV